ncbi:MAG: hypothetical protein E7505_10545 [Ruminococcus sp.]|nr:hypothetical protein [Ruminococcus sp.]
MIMKNNRNKRTAVIVSAFLLATGVSIGSNLDKISLDSAMMIFADDVFYNGFRYTVNDGEVTITGFNDELDLSNVVIPDEIDGKPVTAIGEKAFEGSAVAAVKVSDSVTSIGSRAFANCYSLKELNLGKNTESVGDRLLSSQAYKTPMSITKLILPDNLKAIGNNTYGDNGDYQTAVSVLEISADAVSVPSVFYNRATLKEINVAEGNKNYSSDKGVLYTADKKELIKAPSSTALKIYTVCDGTESIANNAFSNSALTVINVSDSVKTLGNYVFANCYSLKELNLGKNTESVGNGLLSSQAYKTPMSITKLTLPDNLKTIGNNTYGDNGNYQTAVSVLEISADAETVSSVFYNRATLKEINVADGGAHYSSDKGVLYNADKTVLIKSPSSTDMTAYDVCETTQTIGDNAFSNSVLTEINVSDSVQTIGNYAFSNCISLRKLNLGKNVEKIGNGVMASAAYGTKMNIETLTIPESLKVIGNNIYGDNSNYQTIVTVLDVPASAEDVPAVFYNKSTLKEINVAEGGKNYSSDNGVLYNGDKTVLIKCPRSTEASEYKIADETTTVSSAAFEGTGHKGVYFPAGIRIIGNNVFNSSLKIIYGYTGTVAETYANEHGFGFVSLGEVSEQPPVTTKPSVTTPSVTTAKPPVTTPSVTTAKPPVTTPSVTTAKPPVTTPSVTTAKPPVTTPSVTTAKPPITTPSVTTTKPSVTTPAITTTKPPVTTPVTTPAEPPVSGDKNNYDVDGNGKIDIMDLLKLKIYLLS